jgi:hypothetical protein
MSLHYSKTTLGFYDDDLHTTLPSDAVSITQLVYDTLISEQSQGKIIIPDSNGYPISVERTISEDQINTLERVWRDSQLAKVDHEIDKIDDIDPKSQGTITEWRTYRKELRGYPESVGFFSQTRPISPYPITN